jgi:hypothetical protein
MDAKTRCDKYYAEVVSERERQLQKWGDEFDAKNSPNDWTAYIAAYVGKTVTMPFSHDAFRTALIKIAALCFAALEWSDRGMKDRHYDKQV